MFWHVQTCFDQFLIHFGILKSPATFEKRFRNMKVLKFWSCKKVSISPGQITASGNSYLDAKPWPWIILFRSSEIHKRNPQMKCSGFSYSQRSSRRMSNRQKIPHRFMDRKRKACLQEIEGDEGSCMLREKLDEMSWRLCSMTESWGWSISNWFCPWSFSCLKTFEIYPHKCSDKTDIE